MFSSSFCFFRTKLSLSSCLLACCNWFTWEANCFIETFGLLEELLLDVAWHILKSKIALWHIWRKSFNLNMLTVNVSSTVHPSTWDSSLIDDVSQLELRWYWHPLLTVWHIKPFTSSTETFEDGHLASATGFDRIDLDCKVLFWESWNSSNLSNTYKCHQTKQQQWPNQLLKDNWNLETYMNNDLW